MSWRNRDLNTRFTGRFVQTTDDARAHAAMASSSESRVKRAQTSSSADPVSHADVGVVARLCASKQYGVADLPHALLQKVFVYLPFYHKTACESVCRCWKRVLRCSPDPCSPAAVRPTTLWGRLYLHCWPRDRPCLPIKVRDLGHVQFVDLSEAHDALIGQQAAFIFWLQQRAAGFKEISLSLSDQEVGDVFLQLLLGLNVSSSKLTRATVDILSGMYLGVTGLQQSFVCCLISCLN